MASIKHQTITGFIWRFLQNAGSQVIGFIVSIVLARILLPSDYGLIAMITVFTSIANVFITTGFSSSIIQKKDLSEVDKNTVFLSGLITSFVLYLILFFAAPCIAKFYHEPQLIALLRMQSTSLIISALCSTHSALLSRELLFKKSFISSLSGVCVQGVVGITLAYMGFGPWALVYSYLAHNVVSAIILWIIVKWVPRIQFSWFSFNSMFVFSFKILCVSLVNTAFQNIQSLVIGRRYTSVDLANYNRGNQFPSLIMQQVDGSINTVLFSSLSKYQDDWENGLRVLRHAMRTSVYCCFPIMIGMCACAEPMVLLLLTDKWIGCVPFVRISAIICLFWPLSSQKNALNALGKSGIPLAMNICSHTLTLILIFLTYKISVLLMVSSALVSSSVLLVVGAFIYRKHLNYAIKDQLKDVVPTFLISLVMGAFMLSVTLLHLRPWLTLSIQAIIGIAVYIGLSHVLRLESYTYLINLIKPYFLSYLKKR